MSFCEFGEKPKKNGRWYLNKWARDQLAPFRLYRVFKDEMSGIDSMIENTTWARKPNQLEDIYRTQMTFHRLSFEDLDENAYICLLSATMTHSESFECLTSTLQ